MDRRPGSGLLLVSLIFEPARALFVADGRSTRDQAKQVSTFKASAHIIFAHILLGRASHVASINGAGIYIPPTEGEGSQDKGQEGK